MAMPETDATLAVPPAAPEPAWRAPAVGLAAALILFCAATAVAMLLRYAQERGADPLNDRSLMELRSKFLANPEDEAAKQAIREKDLAVRRDFFAIQWHLNAGAWMLVAGCSALVILLNLLIVTRAPEPDQESLGAAGGVWAEADRRRRALAAFAVAVLVLGSIAAAVLRRGAAAQGSVAPGTAALQKVEDDRKP